MSTQPSPTEASPAELCVLSGLAAYPRPAQVVHKHILTLAREHFWRRKLLLAGYSTRQEWKARQRWVREQLAELFGGLPEERAPLNPRITGVIEKRGYRIEKVIFESLPEFYVTANLYVPSEAVFPAPGVLCPVGHWKESKAVEQMQRLCAGLALQGYVALTYDPPGQGERSQYLDPDGSIPIPLGTAQHFHAGHQCYLIGTNIARYFVWDGIRALDYLCSRPEVDPQRIGCTGASGGGTQTAYLTALDPRIKASVPAVFITSRERWLERDQAADDEQCPVDAILEGIEHADLLLPCLPGAVLINAATRDFFPLVGARETYLELLRVYQLFGIPERVGISETDCAHDYSKPMREATYAWFNRWLKHDRPGQAHPPHEHVEEPPIEIEPPEALNCTPTGQVLSSLGGRTIFHLNRALAEEIIAGRPRPWHPHLGEREELARQQEELRRRITTTLRYTPPAGAPPVCSLGHVPWNGLLVERLLFESEPGVPIPGWFIRPEQEGHALPATLALSDEGKLAVLELAAELVRHGVAVLAVDVRGRGETAADPPNDRDVVHAADCLMLGRWLFTMRLYDAACAFEALLARPDVDADRAGVAGLGVEAGLLALHLAALEPRVAAAAVHGGLTSFASLVLNERHAHSLTVFIPAALWDYDLPDAAALVAPRPLLLAGLVDQLRRPVPAGEGARGYSEAEHVYAASGVPMRLAMRDALGTHELADWVTGALAGEAHMPR